MRIVYLCHSFYPEISAPATRLLEMSSEWLKLGHQVTVVTCFPNHPTGIIPEEYRGRFFMEEVVQGIRVLRSYVFATPNKGVFKRLLAHLSFMFSAVVFSLPRLGKVDVIIGSSPTFLPVLSALVISWVKRIPFIFEVRDLWPAAIFELEVIRTKKILKVLEWLELFLYRRAKKVVVVTQSFKDNLVQRGIPAAKVEVVYNGVEPARFSKIDPLIKKKYGLEKWFVILYSGTHGLSHSLETVLQVAARFQAHEKVLFLFVGEGARKMSLQDTAEKMKLKNVSFWPGQARETMPEIYALADVCIVSLKRIPLFTQNIPSKIFEIMASKRPMIACLEGESALLLEKSKAAIVVQPENQIELEKAIRKLMNDDTLRLKMGQNGALFVAKYFNRSDLAKRYEEIIAFIVKKGRVSKIKLENRHTGARSQH